MNNKLVVKECYRTSIAYPSHWIIKLENGQIIYIKYNLGHFTLTISPIITDNMDDALFNGLMNEDELIEITKGLLDWSKYNEPS